jgi:hypothetical protein
MSLSTYPVQLKCWTPNRVIRSKASIWKHPQAHLNNRAMPPLTVGKGICNFFRWYGYRIDTVTLAIDGFGEVGRDPEGICIKTTKSMSQFRRTRLCHRKLWYNCLRHKSAKFHGWPKPLKLGTNPYQVFADSEGDVYVTIRGKLCRYCPSSKKSVPITR